VLKEDIYKMLIRMHKWTFDQVSDLNIWQQLLALDVSFNKASDVLEFSSMEEYNEWQRSK